MSGAESNEFDEVIDEFVIESKEHLDDVENKLLRIEELGADIDDDLVNEVFRAIHSVKGAAGFLGFVTLGNLAHALESVLDRIRQRDLVPVRPVVEALLEGTDRLVTLLGSIHESNDADVLEEVESLLSIVENGSPEEQQEREFERQHELLETIDHEEREGKNAWAIELPIQSCCMVTDRDPESFFRHLRKHGSVIDGDDTIQRFLQQHTNASRETVRILFATDLDYDEICTTLGIDDDCLVPAFEYFEGFAVDAIGGGSSPSGEASPARSTDDDPAHVSSPQQPQTQRQQSQEQQQGVPARTRKPRPSSQTTAATKKEQPNDSSVRVSVALLDSLMNYSGELVLARNQLLQALASNNTTASERIASRINIVTSELQEAVMHTRLQPIGNVFAKFTRVVRDLSKKLDKECTLDIEGGDVDLDRKIIQAIGDPLTHLVRNSVDHGIEPPKARVAAGKPSQGKIQLSARHQGGTVQVTIRDDGRGIDTERLREKAVEKGILRRDEAERLSERDACRLIFHPGFSTAERVTEVSGRGVGMDVVKSNIEKLGGTIEIESEVGVGTTITVIIPLTLAILASMVVNCGNNRYVIPQSSILEIVRIRPNQDNARMESVQGHEVLRLRGMLLPLVRLSEILGIESTTPRDSASVVVVESGLLRFGIAVDEVVDAEEIVVKPLGKHLKERKEYAGATILGDGRIGLILDLIGIATQSKLSVAEEAIRKNQEGDEEDHVQTGHVEISDIVLFQTQNDEQFAIYLGQVARIARIHAADLSVFDDSMSIAWEGSMIPAIDVHAIMHGTGSEPSQPRNGYVLIHERATGNVALFVDKLLDIRRECIDLGKDSKMLPGVCGVFIAEDKPTRLVEIDGLVTTALPDYWTRRIAQEDKEERSGPIRILFAEDSAFFRNLLVGALETEGFEVRQAEDGEAAWNQFETGCDQIDVVVTDIEMPKCDGLELTRRIRKHKSGGSIPIIALTSLANEDARKRGIEAGVDEYQIKLEKQKLLDSIRHHAQTRK
ncbi:MAG: chemotaxis protein CheW [Planctomycetes bacterium]|nr:chemotaxis protein CheW [Planctomycetota bacterium]